MYTVGQLVYSHAPEKLSDFRSGDKIPGLSRHLRMGLQLVQIIRVYFTETSSSIEAEVTMVHPIIRHEETTVSWVAPITDLMPIEGMAETLLAQYTHSACDNHFNEALWAQYHLMNMVSHPNDIFCSGIEGDSVWTTLFRNKKVCLAKIETSDEIVCPEYDDRKVCVCLVGDKERVIYAPLYSLYVKHPDPLNAKLAIRRITRDISAKMKGEQL